MRVDLRQVVFALSDALDLVGIDHVGHGKRVGVMAVECGQRQGLDEPELAFLFELGMLHDIGVSSTRVHRLLTGSFDWEGTQEHCEIGAARLEGFGPLANMALPVLYHHTRWERLVAMEVPPRIAWQANLILLCDRVDALATPAYLENRVLQHMTEIRAQIADRKGSYFSPELVDLFLDASQSEAFWLQLEPRGVQNYLRDMLELEPAYQASIDELRQIAGIFAQIVDAKSPFTAEHSTGVAGVTRFLAERLSVSPENIEKLELAGLLHDLGKLRVPDEILDKPGKLDPDERLVINAHSFETYQLLRNLPGFEEIALWAACHHEEPGGSGYPFRLKGEELSLEARILRVADIFQAMVQHRPYRPGLSADELRAFFSRLVAEGRADGRIVAVLMTSLDQAIQAARSA